MNLQIAHIRSLFDVIKNFPETKNEFKNVVGALAEKALGLINADWVIFKIIDASSQKTILEYGQARGGKSGPEKHKANNKNLLNNEMPEDCFVLASTQDNLGVKAFCIMPAEAINENQKIILGVIINNLSVYYLLFVSVFHKK